MMRNYNQSKILLTHSLKFLIFPLIKDLQDTLSSMITINAQKFRFFCTEVALNIEARDLEQWSHQENDSTFLFLTDVHHQQQDLNHCLSFVGNIELSSLTTTRVCYHSSGSPRLRKSLGEVTTDQSFDLVASHTKWRNETSVSTWHYHYESFLTRNRNLNFIATLS